MGILPKKWGFMSSGQLKLHKQEKAKIPLVLKIITKIFQSVTTLEIHPANQKTYPP